MARTSTWGFIEGVHRRPTDGSPVRGGGVDRPTSVAREGLENRLRAQLGDAPPSTFTAPHPLTPSRPEGVLFISLNVTVTDRGKGGAERRESRRTNSSEKTSTPDLFPGLRSFSPGTPPKRDVPPLVQTHKHRRKDTRPGRAVGVTQDPRTLDKVSDVGRATDPVTLTTSHSQTSC